MLRPVFHLSVVVFNIYSLWYDQMYLDFPFPSEEYKKMHFKGRHMFLTFWCFMLQTVYFSISFLNDIAGTNAATPKKTPLIRSIKDTLFSSAFPVALYVSFAFWCIYAIDKELVFPETIERIVPVWLNHSLHTLIAVFMYIELFATNRNYPSRKTGITLFIVFSLLYVTWLHVLHSRHGAWPYPIFQVLNLPQRIAYFAFSTLFAVGFYVFGEKLNPVVATESAMPYVYVNGQPKKKK